MRDDPGKAAAAGSAGFEERAARVLNGAMISLLGAAVGVLALWLLWALVGIMQKPWGDVRWLEILARHVVLPGLLLFWAVKGMRFGVTMTRGARPSP